MTNIIIAHDHDMRSLVFEAEAIMKEMPQVDIDVKHHFSKDVYAREITIPAGVTLVGEIHKFENLNIESGLNFSYPESSRTFIFS